MKKGIQLNVFDELGYARWGNKKYQKLKEHGFSCIDFDMSDTNTMIYTSDEAEIKDFFLKEKKLAFDSGIEFYQVHGPWRWPVRDFTEPDREERMEKMKKSIRYTSLLGAKYWVVHPIMPFGVEDLTEHNEDKTWELNIEFMKEILGTAKEYNVTICLENMPLFNFSISKLEDIYKFVKNIDDDNFKICFDTGHAAMFKELNIYDDLRKYCDEIKVFHIHDSKWNMDLHLFPNFGDINWQEFSKALADIGYCGCFSLETAIPNKLSDKSFDNMTNLLSGIADDIISQMKG